VKAASINVCFECPDCARPSRLTVADQNDWLCPYCEHVLPVQAAVGDRLERCAVCGNEELYRKKDFPQWLGLTILAAACAAFFVCQWQYWMTAAWAILLGSALVDGLLYLWVGDAIVCYRCGARHQVLARSTDHQPFELGIAERFRQERIRRQQLHAEKKSGA
jgi:hypothetical protein